MPDSLNQIISTCNKLTKKPMDDSPQSRKLYEKAKALGYDKDIGIGHGTCDILEIGNFYFYKNIPQDIGILIYKCLSLDPADPLDEIDEDIFNSFDAKRQILKDEKGKYCLVMQEGDIQITFGIQASQKLFLDKSIWKSDAIIKGEECFIHQKKLNRDSLVTATQQDISIILRGLTKLL